VAGIPPFKSEAVEMEERYGDIGRIFTGIY
jgi:hypothetical protein